MRCREVAAKGWFPDPGVAHPNGEMGSLDVRGET